MDKERKDGSMEPYGKAEFYSDTKLFKANRAKHGF